MKLLFVIFSFLITPFCFSQVIINEIQSSNSSTIADNYGEYDDWIEIYNPNDFDVDIGGLVLRDNVDTWQIPLGDTNTLLLPDSYFLLWADDEEIQGKFHTNFKLSASNGEFLGLFESDSTTVIESVNIPPLSQNQSYGKCQENNWTVFSNPTPLFLNDCPVSGNYYTENNNFLVYPTISNGDIYVDLQSYTSGIINLNMFSIKGELVLSEKYCTNSFTVDLKNLTPGMYILKMLTEKKLYIKKIIYKPLP